ncbi:hypothetical protein HYX16_00675 [Candidatus Woesearchaeota archaeon]|nr:hypothetical protein [Candidatus Woesearchaeota archaeon]
MVKKITNTEIIGLFLTDYSKRYYLREMADLLKKPHQTIKPYIEALVKENILLKNERKNITEYSLNFNNKRIYDYLTIAEKDKFFRRINEDTLIRILFEKFAVFFRSNIFIIFGSAVNKIQPNSDIDLLVVGKQNMTKYFDDFEKIYNKKIHKIQINKLNDLTLTLAKEVYKKHLILNNTEEVIRFFGELYEKNKLV